MKRSRFFLLAIAIMIGSVFTSCKPYQEEKFVDLKSNETAIQIPLETNTVAGQVQLKSIEFLEKNKVQGKRVYNTTKWHSTGYMWWSGWYVPTTKIIIVDRSMISKEWTNTSTTGSSNKDEGITVESKNSIGFKLPVVASAMITEENTARFLYFYTEKSLSDVMDNVVRPYVATQLALEFGARTLKGCQDERGQIYKDVIAKTIKFFAEYGITITNLGIAGQFTYVEPEIQSAINREFIADKKNDAADKEVLAANKFIQAADAITKQKTLDAQTNLLNSMSKAIEEGKFLQNLNTLVMGNDQTLGDLFAAKNLGVKK